MSPTLAQVLALVEAARRSPHARRVLHDALLERYGAGYESVIDYARELAAQSALDQAIILRPDKIAAADERWRRGKWFFPSLDTLVGGDALEIHAVEDVRAYRRYWRGRKQLPDEMTLLVVRAPRGEGSP